MSLTIDSQSSHEIGSVTFPVMREPILSARTVLSLNLLNSLFVRKACEPSSIANDFYHCLAIIMDQVCNIESEILAVGLERF